RAASARAITDARVLRINGSTFDQMLRDNPEIAVRMMRKLSRRLRETDELLRGTTLFKNSGTEVSREMPTPALRVPAEGPEKLIHTASGMERPLKNGPERTRGLKIPSTGAYLCIARLPRKAHRSAS